MSCNTEKQILNMGTPQNRGTNVVTISNAANPGTNLLSTVVATLGANPEGSILFESQLLMNSRRIRISNIQISNVKFLDDMRLYISRNGLTRRSNDLNEIIVSETNTMCAFQEGKYTIDAEITLFAGDSLNFSMVNTGTPDDGYTYTMSASLEYEL